MSDFRLGLNWPNTQQTAISRRRRRRRIEKNKKKRKENDKWNLKNPEIV
jgi:hypothetical protein